MGDFLKFEGNLATAQIITLHPVLNYIYV